MNDIINNTEEAIIFGQSMNEEMKNEMIRGQKMYHAQSRIAMKEQRWEDASVLAYKSQLCREAVEAFDGTLKLRYQ